jgi:hypothetical protein
MGTIRQFLAGATGATGIEYRFGADDAKAEIGAAVRYLLQDAPDGARGEIVREIVDIVHSVANEQVPSPHHDPLDSPAPKQAFVSGVTYRDYVIDTFQRDQDNWRATIRRLDGKKVRVNVPPLVRGEFTTSIDALTAEKAVEFAKKAIERGEVV